MAYSNIYKLDCALTLISEIALEFSPELNMVTDASCSSSSADTTNPLGHLTREDFAIHSCLTSSRILLSVVREMRSFPMRDIPTVDRLQRLNHLVEETKAAGRASYHAALLLTGMESFDESKETFFQRVCEEKARFLSGASGSQ